jgi:prepilin-type N-terminal cleavage/methylation domain-containing protein
MKTRDTRINKGFSLVETLVAIALIAILAAIALPRYRAYINSANQTKCLSNMYALERETYLKYTKTHTIPEIMAASAYSVHPTQRTGMEKIFAIINPAFVTPAYAMVAAGDAPPPEETASSYVCPSGGVYVVAENLDTSDKVRVICSLHGDLHYKEETETDENDGESGTPSPVSWNFQSMKKDGFPPGVLMTSEKAWKILGGGNAQRLTGTGSNERFYFPNPKDEYTVSTVVRLKAGRDWSVGYGIILDGVLANNKPSKDSGVIVQFDRGYDDGKIVFRARNNGNENYPFAVLDPGRSTDKRAADYDPVWWSSEHKIDIQVVRVDSNTKEIRVKIDGVEITGKSKITYKSTTAGGYTGLRVWGEPTDFASLSVS